MRKSTEQNRANDKTTDEILVARKNKKRKRVEVLLGRAEGFVMPLRFTLEFDPALL